jgi:hypothetical protein
MLRFIFAQSKMALFAPAAMMAAMFYLTVVPEETSFVVDCVPSFRV